MSDRGVIFTGDSVRGIIAGRKTQTRRLMKPQPELTENAGIAWKRGLYGMHTDGTPHVTELLKHCPYGVPGDNLWVRETWYDDLSPPPPPPAERERHEDGSVEGIEYRASHDCTNFEAGCPCNPEGDGKRSEWRSPRYMPRWASRLTLKVTGVRVERVQGISDDDAIAEGVQKSACGLWCGRPHRAQGMPTQHNTPREAFASIWDNINGKRAPWSSNCWCWVVDFRRVI